MTYLSTPRFLLSTSSSPILPGSSYLDVGGKMPLSGIDLDNFGSIRFRLQRWSSVDPLAAATCFFGQYYVALIAWTSGNFGGRETVEALLRGSLELIRDGLVPVVNSQEPRDM